MPQSVLLTSSPTILLDLIRFLFIRCFFDNTRRPCSVRETAFLMETGERHDLDSVLVAMTESGDSISVFLPNKIVWF